MTRTKAHLFVTAVVSTIALAGCTNTKDDINIATVAKTVIDSQRDRRQGTQKMDPRIVNAQVQLALRKSEGPLALLRVSKTGSVALLREIETNGAYSTWSAWGTTERRSITTLGGIITATRGLGTDLMSSSVNGLLKMVTQKQDGIAQQVLRHLDGENQIEETEAYCAFTPEGRETYKAGALRLPVTRVDVFCKTDRVSFSNYYLVSESGRIVESQVWLGDGLGYFTLSHLR